MRLKKILFFDFWNCTPHLETSFEIAKAHLDQGDDIKFYFCGHDTLYKEGITVSPDDCGLFRKLPEVKGAELIGLNKKNFYARVKFPQVLFDIPEQFNNLDELMSLTYTNFNVGMGVASSLISNTKNSHPDLKKYHKNITVMTQSAVQVYEFAKKILLKEKPDFIYLFNGRFCNHRAVKSAADELMIEIKYHERGANKFLYYLQNYMPHDIDKWQDELSRTWNSVKNEKGSRELGASFFKNQRKGVELAWTSFIVNQKRDILPNINPSKKIITFFTSSDDEYVAIGDLFKFEFWENQFEALNDLIKICKQKEDVQLFIRIHPHIGSKSLEDQQRWLAYKNLDGVNLISYDSVIDTYALIDKSDVVVTVGSTVGIEAAYWGKVSITLGPSYYSKLNATYHPETYEELEKLINDAPDSLNEENILAFGYFMTTFGNKFKYFAPENLFKGTFLGVDLQEIPKSRGRYLKIQNRIKKIPKIFKYIKSRYLNKVNNI